MSKENEKRSEPSENDGKKKKKKETPRPPDKRLKEGIPRGRKRLE
jgi:hypothetical protein